MYNRRKFIQTTALSAAAVALSKACTTKSGSVNQPIVISTWDFGVAANADAWKVLSTNGKALDAVENGVKVAEADVKNQSVGYGGLPDRDGIVTLDACIMDHLSNCGAVLALEQIKHPISVARLVMEKTPHVMLAGDGALQFALEQGFKKENLLTESSKKAWEKWLKTAKYSPTSNIENKLYDNALKAAPEKLPGNQYNHDTIGMLALDSHGNLAGACTTSGMAYKLHGRIGDSPIIGAGLYIDNEVGGATATGVGEEVVRNVGSFLVVELMRQGYSPEEACKEAVMRIIKKKKNSTKDLQVGFLALNKNGEYGAYAIQKGFSFAVCDNQKQDLIVKGKSHY
ncbi:MAG: N(4)-(beta-N-acetylglucosaminyl)-L-asparaginase [Pedobacter sp.]|uniref:N(4)-(beta-N-acetylglucosaminyl)-L-asparaginase n=1 Tax=Pedobacter sp. TaxID=1411316 RepID=UPI00280706B7|nr:N(4)-(beta-N-acetylglucosaminyl)-L-asparaginase [Pedobacter sp.]MDQ8003416.1 N(4)-(beta-N-acetylglucosaminyl)-L-asparaginase [Pedobacter sp.]